jgi:hypothetical protein
MTRFVVFLGGLFAAGVLLVAAVPAHACPPYVSSYRPTYTPYVRHETVYEATPVFAAVFLPVPVATVGPAPAVVASPPAAASVPAVASPPAQAAATLPCEKQLAEVRAELAELRALIKSRGAENPGPVAAGEGGAGRPGLSVLTTSCLPCHGATADKDGKGHRFFADDGSLQKDVPLSKLIARTYRGDMPPPENKKGIKPLSDAEVGRLIEEVGGAK